MREWRGQWSPCWRKLSNMLLDGVACRWLGFTNDIVYSVQILFGHFFAHIFLHYQCGTSITCQVWYVSYVSGPPIFGYDCLLCTELLLEDTALADIIDTVMKVELPDPSSLEFPECPMNSPCPPVSDFPELKNLVPATLSGFAVKLQNITDKLEARPDTC